MKLHKESHTDHGLSEAQISYLLGRYAERTAFFIETIELPEALGDVPCGLYGPIMGDPPVRNDEVTARQRGDRAWKSRIALFTAPLRRTRKVTVIAGPHDGEACILYTAFGGPQTPQEVGELEQKWEALQAGPDRDAVMEKLRASREFWSEHALAE